MPGCSLVKKGRMVDLSLISYLRASHAGLQPSEKELNGGLVFDFLPGSKPCRAAA